VRAFTVRGVGPGGTVPQEGSYGYLDQTGTMRLEANAEWRFRVYGDLWGAAFLDAGNVWLLRYDEARPEGQFKLNTFAKQVALGTGVGLRYDMDFLVFRFDVGIPLHDPYTTGKSGYYNVEGKFLKQLACHFAIGYPF
jgi:outer membrane protein assembly factor BamA